MIIPVKKTIWGGIDSLQTLRNHIAKSGQFFGVDQSGPACDFNKEYPCDISLYKYMGWGLHKGIDIPCATGTEVYASHDGTVIKTSDSLTAGIGIVLEAPQSLYRTVYWHLREYLVPMGSKLKEGDLIAYSDNTGYSLGPHLHFEIKLREGEDYKPVDPLLYLENMKLTKKQVEQLQALEGYNDPQGAEYWTDKELDQYLAVRIPDKINMLQKSLND